IRGHEPMLTSLGQFQTNLSKVSSPHLRDHAAYQQSDFAGLFHRLAVPLEADGDARIWRPAVARNAAQDYGKIGQHSFRGDHRAPDRARPKGKYRVPQIPGSEAQRGEARVRGGSELFGRRILSAARALLRRTERRVWGGFGGGSDD